MKNSKKDYGIAGQSTTEAKKSQKHDANLQKNSTLYFQIGLILCLLGTYALFEMQFQEQNFVIDSVEPNELATIDVAPDYRVEVIELTKPKPLIERSTELIDKYEEVENEKDIIETKIITPEERNQEAKPEGPIEFTDADDPEDMDIFVPFERIEKVPVYPGCEKEDNNEKRRKCMSEKITKLINKKFNTGLGVDYGLSGKQRIFTQFTIDRNGSVTDIQIRGPHKGLEAEAKRVINKIPKMQPGLQRNVPVGVIYNLPIVFDARN